VTSLKGMPVWWNDVSAIGPRLMATHSKSDIDLTATIDQGAVLDASSGPIVIGAGTKVCAGAILRGPVTIGADCLIGNNVMIRGPAQIGAHVRIGYTTEIKQAIIGDRVSIGPLCFVSDSKVDDDAYLGALVRTSNQRLDRQPVSVRSDDVEIPTGLEKLGCWIGARASLGIQVIVLPGRVIARDSLFEPRITISRNFPSGHFRVRQEIEQVHQEALSC
jgi:UDP-N-acetylglucosamine diphosphorylase / glucose-1-phosphate thymidylyltransferase / UDP-N-acetylgalactosamine diphosphorylase / glucosamine-1-phosphate N-acetyltransferase / galactosamine-1-phosphate N-acetyltransferase